MSAGTMGLLRTPAGSDPQEQGPGFSVQAIAAEKAVEVHRVTDDDAADWQDYVRAHPEATFFHRFEWRRLIEEQMGHETHFLMARRGTHIVGVLPLVHVSTRLFGSSLVSLPFCVYGGPLADDAIVLRALDASALDIAQSVRAEHIEYRSIEQAHSDWSTSELYVRFRKQLADSDDANLKAIPRKQRAMVRKGIGNGLIAAFEDADSFYPIHADNMHRHGTPCLALRWFRALQDAFGSDCDALVVRDRSGNAVSAVLSFWFRDEVLPYYAGDYPVARDLAANDFKYWELMRAAVGRGCRVFDYGRSKVGTGPYAFKKNWGFEPTPLHYEYRLLRRASIPQNNPLNPKYRLMIATWRRMPRPVVDWLGPRVARGLG